MGWRESYQMQCEEGSGYLLQQGEGDRPKSLKELSSSDVRKVIANHRRSTGHKAGRSDLACSNKNADESLDGIKRKIGSCREKFNKYHGMYLKEGRDNHYAEMLFWHEKLLPLESDGIRIQSQSIISLRTEALNRQASGRPTRKAEQKTWDEKSVEFDKQISEKSRELSLHAADQFKRLSALGLDVENEHQVLGSSNVQPAAGPRQEP